MCLFGLFDTKKAWYCTSAGHFSPGLDRKGTFCQECTSQRMDHFIVTNAIEDPRFSSHPSIVNRPFVRFYLGVPLVSRGGHLLGTFAVLDFQPREAPPPKQVELIKELAAQAVSALQEDVLGHPSSPDASSDLPCIWLDISTPVWKVMGTNKEWEDLTGVTSSDLARFPGLFSIMSTGDDAEFEALHAAVWTAAGELEKRGKFASNNYDQEKPSLPAILTPFDTSGEDLQFVFALKPAEGPPPISTGATPSSKNSLWIAEVHGRVRSTRAPPSTEGEPRTSSEDLRPVRLSLGSGSRTPLNGSTFRTTGTSGSGNGGRDSGDYNVDAQSSVANSEEIRIPARLSTLQMGQLLGKGSYGSVYAGVLRGRPVAVKIIESISGPDQEAQQWEAQFEAFISLFMRRSHQNIVPTIDWIREESTGQTWILQELCNLGTLASLYKDKILIDMSTGKPDMLSVLDTALDIARGMEYLHTFSILHGDLSSNNVLLASSDTDGRGFDAKVTDFGLSRVTQREVMTKTVGTVSHMPPELLVDGVMTKAGDVYSYGVVLWEMWNGKRAWEGASMGQVVFAVTVRGQRLTLPADAPPELAKLVEDCIQTDRTLRPEFSEIVKRLEKMKSDWISKNQH